MTNPSPHRFEALRDPANLLGTRNSLAQQVTDARTAMTANMTTVAQAVRDGEDMDTDELTTMLAAALDLAAAAAAELAARR